jgi:hypothetical protein
MGHNEKTKDQRATKGEPALDAVSRRLREYYDSVKEEAIPDRFLDLLEKLDSADRDHQSTKDNEKRA